METKTDQKIYISIPQEASGDISYYCTAHAGMGNTVSVQTPDTTVPTVVPADIVLASESGGVASFEIYADASVDPQNDGFGSFGLK